jgi:hypothetical protein
MNRRVALPFIFLAAALAACSQSGPLRSDTSGADRAASPATPSAALTAADPAAPAATATPAGAAIASPRATPRPSPSAAARDTSMVLAADGVGPYRVGASLADLRSRRLVKNIGESQNCGLPWQIGEAANRYEGRLSLAFESGRLTDVATSSKSLATPSGARVGMTLDDLRRIYGDRGNVIRGYQSQAFSVRVAGTTLGILFYFESLDSNPRPNVLAIAAGEVERLERAAVVGEGC